MNILVVGGAGYIGSHMVKKLGESGHQVTTLDNLSTGFRKAVIYGDFIEGCLSDKALLCDIFANNTFDAVMHFAALSIVSESVSNPNMYYQNNVANTLNLLDAMLAHDVKTIIFSSTAAIFGNPEYSPIDERHPTRPINPYGQSKLMVETVLNDYHKAFGLKYVALRYFNAAGADPEAELGENHDPETHLIPIALEAALGVRESLSVFGDSYATPDGTCVRDYIHINDLADAHLKALLYLNNGGDSRGFNLGNGNGYSVREVIDIVKSVSGINFDVNVEKPRAGDPSILVADATDAINILHWRPQYPQLTDIVTHAHAWAKSADKANIAEA